MDVRPNLAELTEHVPVGKNWHQLGIHLALEGEELDGIDQQYSFLPDKLSHMFQLWLRRNPHAKRSDVIEALKKINENNIASDYEIWIRKQPDVPLEVATGDDGSRALARTSSTADMVQQVVSVSQLYEVSMTDHAALFNVLTSLDNHDAAITAYELKMKFILLSIDIMKLLQSKFDDAKQLVHTILCDEFLCPSDEVKENYQKALDKVKNVKELFKYLLEHHFMSYLNYWLLEEMSKLINNEKINRQFKIYEEDHADFLKAKFHQIIAVFHQFPFLKPAAIVGFPLVKFQLQTDRPDLLPSIYQFHKHELISDLIARRELQLGGVTSSRITITYSILCSTLTDLKEYFKNPANIERFQSIGVSVTLELTNNTSEVLIPSITDTDISDNHVTDMVTDVQLEVSKPASQVVQRYGRKISQIIFPIEQVQLLYTEKFISRETLHDVEKLGGVLSGSPLEELCTTVSKDLNMLRALGSILLKSVVTVPLAYEILKEPDQKCLTMNDDSVILPQVKESALQLFNVSQSESEEYRQQDSESDQSLQKDQTRKRRHSSNSKSISRKRSSSPQGDFKYYKYESHSECHPNTSPTSHVEKKLKLADDEVPEKQDGNSCIHFEKSSYSPGYLKDQYLSLITSIRPHIVAGLPFVADVKTFLSHTFQEMRPQLAHAETADDIVTLVEENCSIDNVYCLESLVDHFDIQPAKALVEGYKAQVEEVLEETSISDWLGVSFRSPSSRYILLKQDTMEIHLSLQFLQCSLKATKDLVSKFFNGFANRLLMESIQMSERSAICVKYSVPHHLIDVLQFEANKCLHELEQEGVISLTIGHSMNMQANYEALRKENASLREQLSEQSAIVERNEALWRQENETLQSEVVRLNQVCERAEMQRKMDVASRLANENLKKKQTTTDQHKEVETKQLVAIEKVFRGTVFHSLGPETVQVFDDAVIGVDKSGNIAFVEEGSRLEQLKEKFDFPDQEIHQLKSSQFLMPGFVDTHIHPPQFPIAGTGYDEPLDVWLKEYIYPCEEQFTDPSFARKIYSEVVKHTLKNGTTTASYIATLHLESSKELCKVIAERKQRALVGKPNMDINFLSNYIESTQQAIDETSQFINFVEKMENPLIQPVITPRTLPNCSRELLKQLARIANEKGLHIQSILCQVNKEIELVQSKTKHPDDKSCTEILEKLELLTEKTCMAHCVHMSEEELLLLKKRNVGIAHTPHTNSNQRSGTMDARDRLSRGIKIGLGTDSSGKSILDVMNRARDVSNMLLIKAEENGQQYTPITLDEAFYMATLGGAQVLSLDDQIGNFKVGKQFDALIVDVKADHPLPSQDTVEKKERILLDKFIHNGDDRNIIKVFVAGHEVKADL